MGTDHVMAVLSMAGCASFLPSAGPSKGGLREKVGTKAIEALCTKSLGLGKRRVGDDDRGRGILVALFRTRRVLAIWAGCYLGLLQWTACLFIFYRL